MRTSIQAIEDFYINLGYKGERLRKALENDMQYQKILKDRKRTLTAKIKISPSERKKYVLSTDDDYQILEQCKILKKTKLSQKDRYLINLIKSQLELEWRKPLINSLNQLFKKYKL